MKIAHMVADGSPGGGTTFVLSLIRSLAGEPQVETHLVTQSGSFLAQRARELGARVHTADFFLSRLDPRVPWRLRSILGSIDPDVIHAHGGRAAFFVSFAPRPKSCRALVYTVHGDHFLHKRLPIRLLGALAERRASATADTTVFVSEGDREIARRWRLLRPDADARVIVNCIDTTELPLAADTKPRLVAFCGRLTEQKDPLLFVETASRLAAHGYKFVILGSGEMESEVRARAAAAGLSDSLTMRTGLPRREALEVLRSAEVLVMTSRWEGLPLVLLEAMAIGVPVIGPEISGLTEVVEAGVSGLLVPERTPEAFAQAVRRVCEDERLRLSMISAGRTRIERHFSHDSFIAKYRELYGMDRTGGPDALLKPTSRR